MKKYYVYTDGGSRNNPGQAAIGFVVINKDQKVLHQEGKAIGEATNNVAEYQALLEALNWLLTNKSSFPVSGQIVFRSDSELMVNQLTGKYRIKNDQLKKLAGQVIGILKQLPFSYTFEAIPRSRNKLADKLVNDALDQSF